MAPVHAESVCYRIVRSPTLLNTGILRFYHTKLTVEGVELCVQLSHCTTAVNNKEGENGPR